MRIVAVSEGAGARGRLKLLGTFLLLLVIVAGLLAIPAIWAH